MFTPSYNIRIGNYRLRLLDRVKVEKSAERLADTATIVLPGTHKNKALQIEGLIKEGDEVEIKFGYDDNLKTEFKGYLNAIKTDDASIKLECEDDLYVFRKALKDRELKNITLKSLLSEVVNEVNAASNTNYSVECSYEFTWGKFVIYKATAFDVLQKVQDETKANIYFKHGVLHIHPQYSKIDNEKVVVYDFAVNVEKSELKYLTAAQRKIEVEVTTTTPDGKQNMETFGTPGGHKESVNAGTADGASAKRLAEERHKQLSFDGYEGSFTGWLVPYCEPAYKIRLQDADYPVKTGEYYVIATDTELSKLGGVRKITIGKRIG